MNYNKAMSHIKENKNKINDIEPMCVFKPDFINEIIENEGQMEVKIAEIMYKNNIIEPVYFNLDLDITYTSDYSEFYHDVIEFITYKGSLLDAAFTDNYEDVNEIKPFKNSYMDKNN